MADLEQQLNSMLSNPELMNQIFSMANALGNSGSGQTSPVPNQNSTQNYASMPFDPSSIQQMMNLMRQTQLEPRQRNLLQALKGYLPGDRIGKLEKAMQAAKIAKLAASSMGSSQNQGR